MSSRKMVLVPEVMSQTTTSLEPPIPPPIKKRPEMDRFHKILKIVLRIALHNAYNEDFRVLDKSGRPVSESDIAALINHALSTQKLLIGEDDFVRILYEAKVDPDWIVNENVRAKLRSYRTQRQPPRQSPPRSPPSQPPSLPPRSPSPPRKTYPKQSPQRVNREVT